ncbi:hypothetical protein LTR36_000868 [Oleoguttula mirabilis]|uniref:Myb-like domain-containing protein n=1 Tax=Oleoguttula mirabilis TaxID=1507867 RepID=A0AAV9J312_9PEZI|nr:hypothetical protein LTR36_000868 [Oleoguttula mirabilis]
MPTGEGNKTPWTDTEKLMILFQIIEKSGPILWNELELPEGRTKQGVQTMIAKEKGKVKKAKDADASGEGSEATPNGKTKRAGDGDDEESPSKKKPKTPRKKKVVKAGGDEAKEQNDREGVKPEPEDDELA